MDLDKFKMGYFILYRNDGSMFAKAISIRQQAAGFAPQDACFTHIEVSGGEIHAINISPPFSKLVDITNVHKGRSFRLVRYKNQDYEDRLRYKVAYFSATLCNKPYDFSGILAFAFKWFSHNNRLYFCSEGASFALQRVFPKAFGGISPDKLMPAHFTDSKQFETVLEGVIE